jgi:hypothetical protein
MPDGRHVVAYCMTAEQTLGTLLSKIAPGNDTRLVSIDIDTGVSTHLPAGPRVKINPSPLSGNEIGYVRKDKAVAKNTRDSVVLQIAPADFGRSSGRPNQSRPGW